MAVTGGRERALLAALVLSAGEVIGTDQLIDALWGESPPRSNAKVLQNLVVKLRKSLGAETIESVAGGYLLRAAPDALDFRRMDRLARAGRQGSSDGDSTGAAAALAGAVGLWRGTPFIELGDWPPAVGERARLAEEHRTLRELWAEAEVSCGHHREWVGELERMVFEEPLREQRWASLMLALYRSGRQADALRAFQRACDALAEIGLKPGAQLIDLEHDISTRHALLAPDNSASAAGGRPESTEDSFGEVVSKPAVGMRSRERLAGSVAEVADPSALPKRRANLPAPADTFVGRTVEVDQLAGLLKSHRQVTVVGTGGIGKTRLAIEVAVAQDDYPAGRWFVALSSVVRDGDVCGVVAASLGIRVPPGARIVEQIAEWCSHQQALIILDNCEHVVDGVARLVTAVIERGSATRLLATSREPLAVIGEHLFPLGPLSVTAEDAGESHAVRLLLDRAIADRPNIGSGVDRASLAEICMRLDGIPLAIELAASRLRMLSPAAIVAGLDDRFGLLTSGRRTADHRQKTLRATIDWSYQLLTAAQRRLFDRLGVFTGSFDLDDVMAIHDDEEGSARSNDALDVLAGLVDRSLVTVAETEPPYRMLETLRTYAIDRLRDTGQEDELRGVHARWFHSKAVRELSESYGPADPKVQRLLRAQRAEYQSATTWSIDHDEVDLGVAIVATLMEASWATEIEGVTLWALPALANVNPVSLTNRARIKWLVGLHHHYVTGDLSAAEEALAEAVRLDRHYAWAYTQKALGAFFGGRIDEVLPLSLQALDVAGDDPGPRAVAYILVGHAHLVVGHIDEARLVGEEFLEWARRLDWPTNIAMALHLLGRIDIEREPARASAAFREALTIATRIESLGLEIVIRREMVSLLLDRDVVAALNMVLTVLRQCRQVNDHGDVLTVLGHAAVVLARHGHLVLATMILGKLGTTVMTAAELQRRARTVHDLQQTLGAHYQALIAAGAAQTTFSLVDRTISELDDCAARLSPGPAPA